MRFTFRRLVVLGSLLLLLVSVVTGLTAANAVPTTKASDRSQANTVQMFVPSACAGLGITNIVSGGFFTFGTNASDLILGNAGGNFILGQGGNDCILGGNGDDFIRGQGGFDICIGGPGRDDMDCEVES